MAAPHSSLLPPHSWSYRLLAVLLLYLPFRSALMYATAAQGWPDKISLFFQIIPELLLLVGLAWAGLTSIRRRSFPTLLSASLSQMRRGVRTPSFLLVLPALALLLWSLASVFWSSGNLPQTWIGIRHDWFGLLALLLIWLAPPSREQATQLLKFLAAGLGAIAL